MLKTGHTWTDVDSGLPSPPTDHQKICQLKKIAISSRHFWCKELIANFSIDKFFGNQWEDRVIQSLHQSKYGLFLTSINVVSCCNRSQLANLRPRKKKSLTKSISIYLRGSVKAIYLEEISRITGFKLVHVLLYDIFVRFLGWYHNNLLMKIK